MHRALFLLFLSFLFGSGATWAAEKTEAQRAADLQTYLERYLLVTDTYEGYEVVTGTLHTLDPGEFAYEVGDTQVWRSYRLSAGLVRGASVMMWSVGGVLAYGGGVFALATLNRSPLAALVGVGVMTTGASMIGTGFVLYRIGKRELGDMYSWWDEATARQLAEEHNRALQHQLGLSDEDVERVLPQPRSRLELRVGVGSVALVGAF